MDDQKSLEGVGIGGRLVRKEFCVLSEMCHSLSPLGCHGKPCSQSSIFQGQKKAGRLAGP